MEETIIAKENNQSLTDQEASDIGVAVAREKVNDFFSNTIETTKSKVENIKLDTMKYWQLYSSLLGDKLDTGFADVNTGGIPSATNPVQVPIYNNTLGVSMGMTDSNNVFSVFQDRYYITKGVISGVIVETNNASGVFTIPFIRVEDYNDSLIGKRSFVNVFYS